VWAVAGKPRAVFTFTITQGGIVAIDIVADTEHVGELDLTILDG
jgi:RNA polymerase sigma-70 factor (ECF subfamily)